MKNLIRITAHPRGAFISVGDWTPTEKYLLLLTTCRSGSLNSDWDEGKLTSDDASTLKNAIADTKVDAAAANQDISITMPQEDAAIQQQGINSLQTGISSAAAGVDALQQAQIPFSPEPVSSAVAWKNWTMAQLN